MPGHRGDCVRQETRCQFVQGASIATLGLLAGCVRLPGQAPPPAKVPRVGFLSASSEPIHQAFRAGLVDLGYVEDHNIVLEWRFSAVPDEWPSLAAELVRLPVDAIVAPPTVTALVAKQATSTIPIVFVTAGDPVGDGLVDSLARPGGNVTGVASLNTLLGEKRLELLKQDAPHMSRVRVCTIRRLQASSRQCTPSWRPPVRWP